MFVAEAVGSSFLGVLIDKLIASPLLEYARRKKVDTTLEEWRRTLTHIEAVLHDAENKQIREKAVKVWLDDLKSLAYDIEDVVDEFDTEAKQRSLTEGPQASTSKVRKLIPTFGALDPTAMSFNKKMGEKIKKITRELDAIAKRRLDLHLREGVGGVSFGIEERLPTTSLVDESRIHGRDADKEKIIELMLSDEATQVDKVSVISIVGMGGIGKTTLAQIIYNDGRVENRFEKRVWVCVSDDFDVVGMTKAILESITNRPCEFKTLESLQEKLKNEMKEKRFFLVLDDVWNENLNHWDVLQAPFYVGAQGSVVLVTTRNENVASIMRTRPSYQLGQLTDEQCWLLFSQQAFKNLNSDACQNLESIGRKIAKKCKGLPLAVKTLAGLLRSKQDSTAWNEVLNNDVWDLPNEQNSILPALNLSYYYLPTTLKRCFAYCSIFPKDYVFEKEKLVLLWMAEGFLDGSKRGETIEEFGSMCFDNLLSRSFFQRYHNNDSQFVMHDLIHDLAQFTSGKFCFRLEGEQQNQISKDIRHSSYICRDSKVFKEVRSFLDIYSLRTFLALPHSDLDPNFYLSKEVSYCLLSTLRCLRVLSLTYYDIKELPHSIENLKHLRYLDLSHTSIRTLPESITTLFNLQTLMLLECRYLVDLPTKMGRLINLRHLKIDGTKLERMPMEMSRMKNLRTLTTFVVGKHTGSRVGELRDLSHLSGTLAILKLQNVADARDALESNMKGKECLDKLELNWEDDNAIAGDSHDAASVLEKLQPHSNLKELSIGCYYGAKFPNWLGEPSFINMVRLQLFNCKNCASLPPLGQLRSLQNLSIVKNDVLQKVGQEFYGNGPSSFKPFGSLQTLVFEEISEWEEWDCFGVEGGEFPHLNELRIESCPKLKGDLPKHLPVLTSLVILECGQLVCQLPEAPSIQKLNLKDCDDVAVLRSVVRLPSITKLEVSNICSIQVELPTILLKLTSLRKLVIKECQSLSSLPEMGLPPMLETLRIEKCHILETLPEGMTQNNTSLQSLYIEDCDSLTSLPIISSLKSLEIKRCRKVELPLPEETTHNYCPWLTRLHINESCDSLTSFPLAFFTKLEILEFWDCENLESFYIPDGLRNMDLTSLQRIHIHNCPNLVSFPQGGLRASNLRFLWILSCMKLKSLPQRMHTLLTSLEYLTIADCPEIVSFPEGGLPTNLSSLYIWNCYKLMESRKEWGLQTLPSLRILAINGCTEEGLESFSEEWLLLPSTLFSFSFFDFPDLKSLDNLGLQNLTSLERLYIGNCVKLKSFPKQGLPASLTALNICRCPVLKKRCQRDKGKEWRKIAHIPQIHMDGEVMD